MPVSAQTLFHFTNSIKAVKGILENNFYPSYCLEKSPILSFEIGIPMVSFCDIPLTQIKNHISEYGKYAIGLKKSWGVNNKLNPVMYVNQKSVTSEKLDKIATYLLLKYKLNLKNDPDINSFQKLIDLKFFFEILYYTKSINGSNWDKISLSYKKQNRSFYDEREWRYVPHMELDFSTPGNLPIEFIGKSTFLDPQSLSAANLQIQNRSLKFTPEDIEYIIVKNKRDIVPMYDMVNAIKRRIGFDENSIKALLTKIIHIERIHEDF